ncbi:MFS transporter [Phenylobacterium sp.]|uniref:MFS transporter n=1 Tax=Phenylobacterium sp. TaxID=1871053 RepID=UPI00374D9558
MAAPAMLRSEASPSVGLILGLCFLAAVCEGFDVQAAGVAAGGIAREFHPAPGALGWFFSAANIGLLIGAVIGGRLSDRLGRKSVLIGSLAIFGLFSLITAFVGDMQGLTIVRLLTGLGLGGTMPNMIATAAGARGGLPKGGDIAFTYIGMPLGGAVASLLVVLLPVEHWRQVFIIGGVTPLATAVAMAMFLPAVLSHPSKTLPAAAGVPVGAVKALFGDGRLPRTLVLWIGFFLAVLTLHLLLNWLPLLLTAQGLTKSQAALAQVGFNVGGAVGALSVGRMLDTRLRRLGVALCVIALPGVLLLLALVHGPATAGLAIVLGGAILALQVVLFSVAGAFYPERVRGTGLGVTVGVGRTGSIVGPLLAGILLAAGGSSVQVLMGLLPMALVGGACAAFLAWRAPSEG